MSILKVDQLQSRTGGIITSPNSIASVGSTIQVLESTYGTNTRFTTSSSNVGLSLTITPKLPNSKIMLMVTLDGVTMESDGVYCNFYVNKNGTLLRRFGYPFGWSSVDNTFSTFNTNILDSVNSLSSITYTVGFTANQPNPIIDINRDSLGTSSIIAMEIAQ